MTYSDKYCKSYCSHGGVCVLEQGHKGKHDSRYCTWTDDEALTRAEADEVLAESGPEGASVVSLWDILDIR